MLDDTERLETVGLRFGTDKASPGHDFLDFYQEQLRSLRGEAFNLYEIGVYRGASLRMWSTWFAAATVVGLDIVPEMATLEVPSNAHIRIGDAGDPQFLEQVVREFGQPTVVVDDGSHRWHHQLQALHCFWPRIRPGGCFIMEDIHTSFPELAVEYRGLGVTSAYDYLIHLQRWVVGNRYIGKERAFDQWIEDHWPSVHSMHWMRGTAVLWKAV